ncbi:hypothetical protein BDF21DRAFT_424105 [Thamnidium elegans]|nr:hypothetical protein BDF21DRAFT_424105 [Thamnidium elegans]
MVYHYFSSGSYRYTKKSMFLVIENNLDRECKNIHASKRRRQFTRNLVSSLYHCKNKSLFSA